MYLMVIWIKTVDPDQTATKEEFDQGQHCLPAVL